MAVADAVVRRGLVVREMQPSDLPQIAQLASTVEDAGQPPIDFSRELAGNRVSRPLAALENGLLAGYIVAWYVADEMEIIYIYVRPKLRRRGVARALLQAALEHARQSGVRRAFLEVKKSNFAAISLYETFGFTIIGTRRAYYADNQEDARVMAKQIE